MWSLSSPATTRPSYRGRFSTLPEVPADDTRLGLGIMTAGIGCPQFGIIFPRPRDRPCPNMFGHGVREAETAGFDCIAVFDHVIGVDTAPRPDRAGPYALDDNPIPVRHGASRSMVSARAGRHVRSLFEVCAGRPVTGGMRRSRTNSHSGG